MHVLILMKAAKTVETIREGLDRFLESAPGPQIGAVTRLRHAWEEVAGPGITEYTGSVIFDTRDCDVVVVFTVNSLVKADLEAKKELFRVQLNRILRPEPNPPLKEVRFVVNRRTAVRKSDLAARESGVARRVDPVPLSTEEDGHARESVSVMRDEVARERLLRAMRADLEWKKGVAGE